MSNSVTWLHISDIHARQRSDWDSRAVMEALRTDVQTLAKENGLRPDFIVVTGDLAFGSVPNDALPDQYLLVQKFLDSLLAAFDPPISKRNLYIVPGNHDVDRNEVTAGEINWLRSGERTLSEIHDAMQKNSKQWRTWMDRFGAYRGFPRQYGLVHLSPDDPHLIWSDVQNIGQLRVGVSGFNSAWSAADDGEKGKLWAGLPFQISKNLAAMGPVDLSIALIHHPGNWFTPAEDPSSTRQLRQDFQIVLHGHEHQDWIEQSSTGHLLISAGACYESSWMDNGYNLTHINFETGQGAVWLREWEKTGRGWVAKNIHRKTSNGVWQLRDVELLLQRELPERTEHGVITHVETAAPPAAHHFTKLFCDHAITQNDFLELFGCDIPRELQRHQLSVAYVSLNLSPQGELGEPAPIAEVSISAEEVDPESASTLSSVGASSLTIDALLTRLPSQSSRLMILGPAGAGKSTLLRWCAIHSARLVLSKLGRSTGAANSDIDVQSADEAWTKVPILLRLRDYKDGRLPPANDFPKIVAKHLQAAPLDWITNILSSGQALVLIDGVDEVHSSHRQLVSKEIEELVKTYPNCTYIITSRPGAIPAGWLERSHFQEVLVEPMNRVDREEFISKWFDSASLELKRRPRVNEDLKQTASNLKSELIDQPDLGLLASNPLVCAMICALYRERQETLPESPSELCEALVQMLVHRREQETPDLTDAHFDAAWRALLYPQKRGILADIAYQMVMSEESAMERHRALDLVKDALKSTPGRLESEAPRILSAIIERSGLLRPASEDRVEFLHNTLKEYLAAARIVELRLTDVCISHADNTNWQPTILFSLSIAAEDFSSTVVRALLTKIPDHSRSPRKRKNLTRAERDALQLENSRAFFLVRCRKSVKRLSSDLSETVEGLTRRLLPPAYMHDVEPLAQLGTKLLVQGSNIFGSPKWWFSQDARTAIRCLRLLRLIGGSKAKSYLSSIQRLPSGSILLSGEWLLANSELCNSTIPWPFEERREVNVTGVGISDLHGLPFGHLFSLDVSWTKIRSLQALAQAKSLRHLNINSTVVDDLSPLSGASSLISLVISSTRVANIAPLAELSRLKIFYAIRCAIKDLDPIAHLEDIQQIIVSQTKVERLPKNRWSRLVHFDAQQSPLSDISELSSLESLNRINISSTRVKDFTAIASLKNLRTLDASRTPVENLPSLRDLTMLTRADFSSSKLSSLESFSENRGLITISVANTKISSIEPLESVRSLKNLSISFTEIRDLGALENHVDLKFLDIANLGTKNIDAIRKLSSLTSLSIDISQIGAVVGLALKAPLKSMTIHGYKSDDPQILNLQNAYPEVNLFRAFRLT